MSHAIGTVCRKEIVETARDRRTFVSLLLGLLLGPLLFVTVINITVSRNITSAEAALDIPITGGESTPNLLAFLNARGIRPLADHGLTSIEDAAGAVMARVHDLVIVIDEQYAQDLATDRGARVTLVFDRSNTRVGTRVGRVSAVLNGYGQQLGSLRLIARGVSPTVLRPVIVDEFDVSTPAGRSGLLLGLLTYFLLFATLAGGLHLAIDTTAGERERKSLEPLLTIPVARSSLLLGKLLATIAYMLVSLALTLAAYTVAFQYLPLEQLGMSTAFGARAALGVFLVLAPFAPLGAALMMTVASFTKTYREAQTYVSFLLLVPTLPVIFATLMDVEPKLPLMWIPSLSQHLLITSLVKDEPLQGSFIALSVLGSLAMAAAFAWLATRLYRREALLG